MKNFTAFSILAIIVIGTVFIAINAFDRHMYPGVNVIGQEGHVLLVQLDDELTTGTDMMCLEATYILLNVAEQSGYSLKVMPKQSGDWVPFNNQIVSSLDLRNIIESGQPY